MAARVAVIPAAVAEYTDDIAAVAGGFIDAFLLRSSVGLFLLKNVAVPIVDKAGLISLPKGLVYESEGMLGFVIGILIIPPRATAAAAAQARAAQARPATALAVARR
jgi:hypothetical protein